jgi:PAS domain S-box-containing protein
MTRVPHRAVSGLHTGGLAHGPQPWRIAPEGPTDLLALQGRIVERFALPVVGIGRDGAVAFVNRAFERRLGHRRERFVGHRVPALLRDFAPDLERVSVAQLRGEEFYTKVMAADGSPVPVGVSVSPVFFARRLVGFLTFLRDRTLELRAMREARLSTAGLFATVAAHEMKNPLQAVKGFIQLAQVQRDISWLDNALEAIQEVAETIDQLLVFAKEPTPFIQAVDVARLLRRTRLFVQHRLGEAELREEIETPYVLGDERLLGQVLLNLTTNAIEACEGQGVIVVRVRRTPEGSVIQVEDSGPGISPAVLHNLFEPFVTTRPQGSGLGLYVCRQIARAHGGELIAYNRPEGGAVFELRLPGHPEDLT